MDNYHVCPIITVGTNLVKSDMCKHCIYGVGRMDEFVTCTYSHTLLNDRIESSFPFYETGYFANNCRQP